MAPQSIEIEIDPNLLLLDPIEIDSCHAFDAFERAADAPVEQYWSVTAYDRKTHALIRNMPRASRSSQIPELQKNADGSVDVYFGPDAPPDKDSNWVPTDPAREFELMFRLYAPTKALFDKSWVLPDAEKVAAL